MSYTTGLWWNDGTCSICGQLPVGLPSYLVLEYCPNCGAKMVAEDAEESMSTSIRSEISQKNEYYIPKEKYLELKYFCLQYPEWKKACSELLKIPENHGFLDAILGGKPEFSDPTGATACMLAEYAEKIQMVRTTAEEADPLLANYILLAVTKGLTYPALYSQQRIPCGRDMFYNRYRKFFWLLAQKRK